MCCTAHQKKRGITELEETYDIHFGRLSSGEHITVERKMTNP
jgi:hypothetical protein